MQCTVLAVSDAQMMRGRDATSADDGGEVNQPPRKQLKPNPPEDGVACSLTTGGHQT